MSLNASFCSQSSGIVLLPNVTTATKQARLCGVRSLNQSLLHSCCSDSHVLTSDCQTYCATNDDINDWAACIMKHSNSTAPADIFCQRGILGNNSESVKKSSASYSKPLSRVSYLLFFLAFTAIFFGNASAKTIPSLAHNRLIGRAGSQSSCTIDISKNYTTIGKSQKVSDDFPCEQSLCVTGDVTVSTEMTSNNRTINGTSAADSKYDGFFDILQNKTSQWFPAMSSIELLYSFASGPGSVHLAFTPFAVCKTKSNHILST